PTPPPPPPTTGPSTTTSTSAPDRPPPEHPATPPLARSPKEPPECARLPGLLYPDSTPDSSLTPRPDFRPHRISRKILYVNFFPTRSFGLEGARLFLLAAGSRAAPEFTKSALYCTASPTRRSSAVSSMTHEKGPSRFPSRTFGTATPTSSFRCKT